MLVSMKFNCLDSEEGIVIPEKILVNKISHSFCYRYIYDSSITYPVRLVQGHSRSKMESLGQKRARLETGLFWSKLKNKLVTCSSISWVQCTLNLLYTTV